MYVRKNLFGSPSFFSIRRPNENLGVSSHLRNLSSYSNVTCMICSTILFAKEATLFTPRVKRTAHSLTTKHVALWVFETETTTTATHAGMSERLEPRYSSVAKYLTQNYLSFITRTSYNTYIIIRSHTTINVYSVSNNILWVVWFNLFLKILHVYHILLTNTYAPS